MAPTQIKHIKRLTDYESKLSEVPKNQWRKPAKSLQAYQKYNTSRNGAIVSAYQSGAYTMVEIVSYFGCHYSKVSRVVAKRKT